MYRTRIKICGVTRFEDASSAADMGVDSLGFMFHRPSSRFIELDQAASIRRKLPPFVTATAVFLDESADWIAQVVEQFRPDCLQFHGSESPEFCGEWGLPYIKAVPMASIGDPREYAAAYRQAQGFLLDSNAAGLLGGSGDTFDWSKIPASFEFPLILAGGINAANVAEAIVRVKPWAVDISSGVEVARGVKDSDLIRQLVAEVKRGDLQREQGD